MILTCKRECISILDWSTYYFNQSISLQFWKPFALSSQSYFLFILSFPYFPSGMTLIPSNDVILRKGSKLYVVCRSEGKFSRFLWFMNGQRVTSPRKLAQSKYGESILRLDAHDLQRKKTHVTCFVPPFKPKRITISVDDGLFFKLTLIMLIYHYLLRFK